MTVLLIGDPSHQRTLGLQQALLRQAEQSYHPSQQRQQHKCLQLHVISYQQLIEAYNQEQLHGFLAEYIHTNQLRHIKLDAPVGEGVTWQLMQLGYHHFKISPHHTNATNSQPLYQPKHGELVAQHYFYHGFSVLLDGITQAINDIADTSKMDVPIWLNHPHDIKLLCDKWQCTQHLNAHGITTPKPLGLVTNSDEFFDLLKGTPSSQVFIKSRYGSSGAGVFGFRHNKRGQQVLYANAVCEFAGGRWRLFNTLKPQRISNQTQIARMLDLLGTQGAYVEQWLPKPKLANSNKHFDMRMVIFLGQARQGIARASSHPLTNLHLGNERIAMQDLFTESEIKALSKQIQQASSAFTQTMLIGFDMIVTRKNQQLKTSMIEANAFGDLLLNVTHNGKSTWDDQAEYMLKTV